MNAPQTSPRWFQKLPPAAAKGTAVVMSLVAGLAVAVVLQYVLYRIGLPSKPFIYVAF